MTETNQENGRACGSAGTPCYVPPTWIEDGNRAVVTDGNGTTLRQLEKPDVRDDGQWRSLGSIETFCTKKEAVKIAKVMGLPADKVEQVRGPLGFRPWAIKYDFRNNYYLACWDA
ncbi:MAG: hypothetical protein DRP02_14875 [Candidatus Gerdarchaeota archaeon]|nr:MAG: hypothetical protein DRP02_14875 [Candidatus Gerdarchaeota archaeon]